VPKKLGELGLIFPFFSFIFIHRFHPTFQHLNFKPMKVYDEKHIKNIALLGAPKSGKTLLSEDMIFEAGIVRRRGTIEGKNTVSDYHEIEQERIVFVYLVQACALRPGDRFTCRRY